MKKLWKKALSMMLSIAMVFGVMTAFGVGAEEAKAETADELFVGWIAGENLVPADSVDPMKYSFATDQIDENTAENLVIAVVTGGAVTIDSVIEYLKVEDVKIYHYNFIGENGYVGKENKIEVPVGVFVDNNDGSHTIKAKIKPENTGQYRVEYNGLSKEFQVGGIVEPYFTTRADYLVEKENAFGEGKKFAQGDTFYYVMAYGNEKDHIERADTRIRILVNEEPQYITLNSDNAYLKVVGNPETLGCTRDVWVYKFEVQDSNFSYFQLIVDSKIAVGDNDSYIKTTNSLDIHCVEQGMKASLYSFEFGGDYFTDCIVSTRTIQNFYIGYVNNDIGSVVDLTKRTITSSTDLKVTDIGSDGLIRFYSMTPGKKWLAVDGQRLYFNFIEVSQFLRVYKDANCTQELSTNDISLERQGDWSYLAYKVGYSAIPQYTYVKVDPTVDKIIVENRDNLRRIVVLGEVDESDHEVAYDKNVDGAFVSYDSEKRVIKINTQTIAGKDYFNAGVIVTTVNNDYYDIQIQSENKPSTPSGGGYTGGETNTNTGDNKDTKNENTDTKTDTNTDTNTETKTETGADGTVTETKTETKEDGTKVETKTETATDGSTTETVKETAVDGTTVETVKETAKDGSTSETKTETKTDGTVKETVVEKAADGSTLESVKETAKDGSSVETVKEVAADGTKTDTKIETAKDGAVVETKTEVAKDGSTAESVKEVAADGKSSAAVEVKKDENGKVTDSVVAVESEVKGKKLTVDTATITDMIAKNDDATVKNTTVVLTANDKNGDAKFTVEVDAKDLKAGAKLQVYAIDKNGKPVIVDTSKNNVKVTKDGDVKLNISGTGDFQVVTPKEAAKIEKAIEKSVKPEKTNVTVKEGEKATFKLDDGCNKDNIAKITYESSNANIKVNKNGKITVKEAGKATITATVTLANGKTKTIKMKIKAK